jgi:hypothetical protein
VNEPLTRILVGMHDYGTGLDMATFTVTADFAIDGAKPGENLATRFKAKSPGVWELNFTSAISDLVNGRLIVSVRDRRGNTARIERVFSVAAK